MVQRGDVAADERFASNPETMGKKQRTGTAPPRAGAWLANAPPKSVKLPAFLPILPPTDEYFPISEQAEQPPSTLDATGAVRVNDAIGPCVVTAGPENSNAEIYDTSTAQQLDDKAIAELRKKGTQGEDIIKALAQNSATFASKTAFAQEYLWGLACQQSVPHPSKPIFLEPTSSKNTSQNTFPSARGVQKAFEHQQFFNFFFVVLLMCKASLKMIQNAT